MTHEFFAWKAWKDVAFTGSLTSFELFIAAFTFACAAPFFCSRLGPRSRAFPFPIHADNSSLMPFSLAYPNTLFITSKWIRRWLTEGPSRSFSLLVAPPLRPTPFASAKGGRRRRRRRRRDGKEIFAPFAKGKFITNTQMRENKQAEGFGRWWGARWRREGRRWKSSEREIPPKHLKFNRTTRLESKSAGSASRRKWNENEWAGVRKAKKFCWLRLVLFTFALSALRPRLEAHVERRGASSFITTHGRRFSLLPLRPGWSWKDVKPFIRVSLSTRSVVSPDTTNETAWNEG